MNYEKFCSIMNEQIFREDKKKLLRIIASQELYFGDFSLLNSQIFLGSCLQHLLQSREIRFGDAMEELISELLREWGFRVLPKIILPDAANKRKRLEIDQYFTKSEGGEVFYFIEQKVRDDHDSTKKKGQLNNFEAKLEFLYKKHGERLEGIMYFVDPDLSKNRNFYAEELKKMEETYGLKLEILYGKGLFEYFGRGELWEAILEWLGEWKEGLPELPEINFDTSPRESFEEIKDLEVRYWRRILGNERLWEGGIMKAIFREGETLGSLLESFRLEEQDLAHERLAELLTQRLKEFY